MPSNYVVQPALNDFKSPSDLNLSLGLWYNSIFRDQSDDYLKMTYAFVDSADIAAAHVEALKKEAAGGERIIVSSGMAYFSDAYSLLQFLLLKESTTWQETRS